MKKNVIFLMCLILSVVAVGQNERSNPNKNGKVAPKFIGSKTESVNDYLTKNLAYPKEAVKCFIDGTEVIQFTVTNSGNVTNCKVINSVCPEIDKEVIRVLKNTSGMWIPGINHGKPTAMAQEVKIPFAFCNKCNIVKNFTRKATMYYKAGVKNLTVKQNPDKALRFINRAMNYLPNDNALLVARGLCNWELGDTASAKNDWKRATALDGLISHESEYDLSSLKGYAQMVQIHDNNKK